MRDKIKALFTGKNLLTACMCIAILLLIWYQHYNYIGEWKVEFNDVSTPIKDMPLRDGTITAKVRAVEKIRRIAFLVQNDKVDEAVHIELFDPEMERFYETEMLVPALKGQKQSVEIEVNSSGVRENGKDWQAVTMRISSTVKDSNVVFATEQAGSYGNLYLTDIEGTEQELRMTVTYDYDKKYFFKMFLMIAEGLFGAAAIVMLRKGRPQLIFFAAAMLGGIALAVTNPISQECDGIEHMYRTVDVSYGNILSPFVVLTHGNNEVVVPENIGSCYVMSAVAPGSGYANRRYEKSTEIYFGKSKKIEYNSMVNSVGYWPQALGLALGRLAGMPVYYAVVLGRIMNLLVYALMVMLAIELIPFCKNIILVIGLMPISLYQAASFSPDPVINGVGILFIATCLNYAFSEREKLIGWREGLVLGLELSVLFLCKYVYVTLGLLVFIIPRERFGEWKDYVRKFAIAVIPVCICLIFVAGGLKGGVSGSQSVAAGGVTQLSFVLHNPDKFVKTILLTTVEQSSTWLGGFALYGWMNYPLGVLPYLVIILLAVAVFVDSRAELGETVINGWQKNIMVITTVLVYVALLFALYVGDGRINGVGATYVLGIQGRYFIPFMALPLIAIRKGPAIAQKSITKTACEAQTRMAWIFAGVSMIYICYSLSKLMEYCY